MLQADTNEAAGGADAEAGVVGGGTTARDDVGHPQPARRETLATEQGEVHGAPAGGCFARGHSVKSLNRWRRF